MIFIDSSTTFSKSNILKRIFLTSEDAFREEDSAAELGEDVFNAGRSLSLSFTPFKFTKKNSSLTVCHKLILSILPIEY